MEEQKIKSSKKVVSAISKSKFNLSIILLDIIAFIFIYFLIPKLLNMPEYSMNLEFQKEAIGFSFLQIFIVAFILVVVIQMLTLKVLSKFSITLFPKIVKKVIAKNPIKTASPH